MLNSWRGLKFRILHMVRNSDFSVKICVVAPRPKIKSTKLVDRRSVVVYYYHQLELDSEVVYTTRPGNLCSKTSPIAAPKMFTSLTSTSSI